MKKGYSKEAGKPVKRSVKKGYDPIASPDDYPTIISFDEDKLPAIKKWKVGGVYKLQLEVEQTGIRQKDEYGGKSDEMVASFKVKSVKAA